MSRWFNRPQPRNGLGGGDEASRAKRESEVALQRQRARAHEVSSIVNTLRQIRERDGFTYILGAIEN